MLPDCVKLRQQLTEAKQTTQFGSLDSIGKRARAARSCDIATLPAGTTPLWCSLAAHQATQHCAQAVHHSALMQAHNSHDHRRCRHHTTST